MASSNEPFDKVETQKKKTIIIIIIIIIIKLACCILYNYLISADPDDGLLHEVDEILNNREPHEQFGAQSERNNDDVA